MRFICNEETGSSTLPSSTNFPPGFACNNYLPPAFGMLINAYLEMKKRTSRDPVIIFLILHLFSCAVFGYLLSGLLSLIYGG
jgi:hypothetical protein